MPPSTLPLPSEVVRPATHSAQIAAELDRILATEGFQRTPALSRLLAYVVEHQLRGDTAALKETVIGSALYDRPATYDPKIDAVVRVNAKRLRERLEEFYAAHPTTGIRITLQRGSYIPIYIDGTATRLRLHALGVSPDEPPSAPPTLPVAHPPWWHSKPILAGAGVALLGLCVALAILLRGSSRSSSGEMWSVRPFARSGGSQQFSDFSPDGHLLAFISTHPGDSTQNLYVQAIGSDASRQITDDASEKSRPAWSPDGNRIAFIRLRPDATRDVVVLAVASGAETTVAHLQGRSPWLCKLARLSWSRDASTLFSSDIVFPPSLTCGVLAIDLASHGVRPLTHPPNGTIGDLEAAVSPDGNELAFVRNFSFMSGDIFALSLKDGTLRSLTSDKRDISGFAWNEDGRSVIVASNRLDGDRRLWNIPLAGGKPEALTDGSSQPYFPTLGDHGRRLSFTRFETVDDIWRHNAQEDTQVIGNGAPNSTPVPSADGRRLVYSSSRSGIWAIWVSDADGTNARQLLRDDGNLAPSSPSWSPDGNAIVFECRSTGNSNICTMHADGTGIQQITQTASNHIVPSWARDGKSIYYSGDATGQSEIYRQDLGTGVAIQITHNGGVRAVESLDGNTLFVHRGGHGGGGLVALPVVALQQGDLPALSAAESKVFLQAELPAQRFGEWQPGKQGILFASSPTKGSLPGIFSYDLPTGKVSPVAKLDMHQAGAMISFSTSPDAQTFYYRKRTAHSDLALMQRKSPGGGR